MLCLYICLLTGVFVSPLVRLYGCKKVAATGSLIYFIAMVLSFVMPYVWSLFITFGFCAGNECHIIS